MKFSKKNIEADYLHEDLLYFVWKMRCFDRTNLRTFDDQPIVIEHYGEQNPYSGPDFSNAKINIGGTLWVGNVEMHIRSSDWTAHKHNSDRAYYNVILHVVFYHDKQITYTNKEKDIPIPTLEIGPLISLHILDKYKHLMVNSHWIPCESLHSNMNKDRFNIWKHSLLTERLQEKVQNFLPSFNQYVDDWERLLYSTLSRYMGAKANMEAFTILSELVDLRLVRKNRYDSMGVDALYFGQAGLLYEKSNDNYYCELQDKYHHLSVKYQLRSMDSSVWKYSGVMPAGFPDLRIAQLSAIVQKNDTLFSSLIQCSNISEMKLLLDVDVADYWKVHYSFKNNSNLRSVHLSDAMKEIIIINAFLPVLFMYAEFISNISLGERVLDMFSELKGEDNSIIKKWKSLGFETKTSLDTQALIYLKKQYCDKKQCLSCVIGSAYMRNE